MLSRTPTHHLSFTPSLALACLFIVLGVANTTDLQAQDNVNNPLQYLPVPDIAAAYGEQPVYDITRNGKSIGKHVIQFSILDDKVVVTIESSITVRILKIPVYRLRYVSTEVWIENQLTTVSATTTENGKTNTVNLNNVHTGGDTKTRFATNHWHPGVLTGGSVFNTLTGEISVVSLTELGDEQLDTRNGPTAATRYRYTDDIEVDVWYDENGTWIKLAFSGDDGSAIEYLRVSE